ncbi:hypothetical protein BC829DRAFT_361453, partial [Chytridium lagenaria]
DCPVFEGLSEYVKMVAGGTLTAAKALISGDVDIAIHWDGVVTAKYLYLHYWSRESAAGFCYVNDVVLGVMELHSRYSRVMYVDIDIHHCDGVENAFAFSSKVLRISFHLKEAGFYPGTGSFHETGKGKGRNHAIQVTLDRGLTRQSLIKSFKSVVMEAARAYRPEAIVMQCGADGIWGMRLCRVEGC